MEELFKYRGRLPTRSDGKERRIALLDAALELIIEDGVRAVRHRAVAEKAQVPLAATTYYFNDIYDLIHDAFIHFTEKALQQAEEFESQSFLLLDQLEANNNWDHDFIVEKVAEFATQYFLKQSQDKNSRVLEQVIRTQALRDENIALIVQAIEQKQTANIAAFINRLALDNAESRAKLVYSFFIRLKYELSLNRGYSETYVRTLFGEALTVAFAK